MELHPLIPQASLWLKAVTQVEHKQTESTAFAELLAKGEISRTSYAELLCAYAELHRHLEWALEAKGLSHLLSTPRKSALADQDLAALGCATHSLPRSLRAAIARACTVDTSLLDEASLLGRLYVLEGSALGSAMLYPMISARLALDDGSTRYFRGHGKETMARFQRFRHELDQRLDAMPLRESARQGAVRAFEDVRSVFEALFEHARCARNSVCPTASVAPPP